MRIAEFIRCDRCGLKIEEYEFMLKKIKRDEDNIYIRLAGDGYEFVGGYCKTCGYLINEAANISKINDGQ